MSVSAEMGVYPKSGKQVRVEKLRLNVEKTARWVERTAPRVEKRASRQ
jgi:hypothetical protein